MARGDGGGDFLVVGVGLVKRRSFAAVAGARSFRAARIGIAPAVEVEIDRAESVVLAAIFHKDGCRVARPIVVKAARRHQQLYPAHAGWAAGVALVDVRIRAAGLVEQRLRQGFFGSR